MVMTDLRIPGDILKSMY